MQLGFALGSRVKGRGLENLFSVLSRTRSAEGGGRGGRGRGSRALSVFLGASPRGNPSGASFFDVATRTAHCYGGVTICSTVFPGILLSQPI